MTKLSVNINKIATIRNARGGSMPDLVRFALDCERFGADGITVHPRPDERHIRYQDVHDLKPVLQTEFNIEGYPSPEFMSLVTTVKPHQVTLVPDPPGALTSNAGWDTVNNFSFLKDIIANLNAAGIRASVFVDTNLKNIEFAAKAGAQRVELYTEPYASQYPFDRNMALEPFYKAALYARETGLGLNAGHDLSLENLGWLHTSIPWIDEVSIGHALISDALYLGIEKTINEYQKLLK